jgi:hypothetical protein
VPLTLPPGLVTVILLGPIVAAPPPVADVLKVAVIVVALTLVTPETVRPFAGATTFTVAPTAKFEPVRVTARAVPRTPKLGAIESRIGEPGFTTVNATGFVFPVGVVTVTFLAESVAVAEIVNEAVTWVSLTTVTALTVIPVPPPPPPPVLVTLTAVAPVRPAPVNVTDWVVPRAPVVGAIEVNDGAVTVKVTALLGPPGAVTVTFLAPAVAVAEMVNVALTWLSLTTVTALEVTPVPLTLTAVVPVKPVPISVTAKPAALRLPDEVGLIDVSTGPMIENGTVLLTPPVDETATFTLPKAAELVLVMVAVIEVALTNVDPLTLTPVTAGVMITVSPATKLAPVRVTACEVPRGSLAGEIEVSVAVGAPAPVTLKATALLGPPGAVTVTL